MTAAPLRKEILRDKVFDLLRDWILTGTLEPGARIVESSLAAQLQVSRAPLREAMALLAHQGLVRVTPHHGAFVTRLSEAEIRDFFEIREVLETHAARKIRAALTPEKKARLGGALAALEKAARRKDIRAFVEADHAFHRTIWQLSGNRHLEDTLGGISARFFGYNLIRDLPHAQRFRFAGLAAEHAEMARLVLEGTPAEIDAGYRKLFAGFLSYLLERLA